MDWLFSIFTSDTIVNFLCLLNGGKQTRRISDLRTSGFRGSTAKPLTTPTQQSLRASCKAASVCVDACRIPPLDLPRHSNLPSLHPRRTEVPKTQNPKITNASIHQFKRRKMSTQNPPSSLYPKIDESHPSLCPIDQSQLSTSSSSSSSIAKYPVIDMHDMVENLFPDSPHPPPSAPPLIDSFEEPILTIPGALLHLIDKHRSIELASGNLTIFQVRQGTNIVAVLIRVTDVIQWPLAKDVAAVRLDDSHYFFSLRVPTSDGSDSSCEDAPENLLNYGLTFASKGQEDLLMQLDGILEKCSSFTVQKVSEKLEVLDRSVAKGVSPEEMEVEKKKEMMEEQSAAYWTTLAPNVEDYSSGVARLIAMGSGQLIKGILWCGDVTVERLKWGDEILKKRIGNNRELSEVSEATLKRIQR